MKKAYIKHPWHTIRAHNELYKTKKVKKKIKRRREKLKEKTKKQLVPPIEIKMAEEIKISDQKYRSCFLGAMDTLYGSIAKHRYIVINFLHTKKLHADGVLLLNAHIRHILELYPHLQMKLKLPHNHKVKQVFTQIGLLEFLNQPQAAKPVDSDVVHWRNVSGHDVNNELSANLFIENQELYNYVNDDLFAAFAEAMTNSIDHAYQGITIPERQDKWWIEVSTLSDT